MRGTVVPNQFIVTLSPEDMERFAGFRDALVERARPMPRASTPARRATTSRDRSGSTLAADEAARRGDLRVDAEIVAGTDGIPGALVLPDGRRVALGDAPAVIGRLPECTVPLSDPQVSRHHAEVRRDDHGFRVVDLDSMNGTQVNGVPVHEHVLVDGDVILVGATSIRYEES